MRQSQKSIYSFLICNPVICVIAWFSLVLCVPHILCPINVNTIHTMQLNNPVLGRIIQQAYKKGDFVKVATIRLRV